MTDRRESNSFPYEVEGAIMKIGLHWNKIRKVFIDSFNSSFHYSIATVNENGSPHVTPIGSLFLGDDLKGFYFEEYVSALPGNLRHNKRVCVLAVNSSKFSLLKTLLFGKITAPPGVRLMGTASEKREATPQEINLFKKRFGKYRMFKGYDRLWGKLRYVREIHFDAFEPVRIGVMTRDLWKE
jgi:hypothetical protein